MLEAESEAVAPGCRAGVRFGVRTRSDRGIHNHSSEAFRWIRTAVYEAVFTGLY